MNSILNIKNSAQVHMSLFELEQIQVEVEEYEYKITSLEKLIKEKSVVISMTKEQRSWPSEEWSVAWDSESGKNLIAEMELQWKSDLEDQLRRMTPSEFKKWRSK